MTTVYTQAATSRVQLPDPPGLVFIPPAVEGAGALKCGLEPSLVLANVFQKSALGPASWTASGVTCHCYHRNSFLPLIPAYNFVNGLFVKFSSVSQCDRSLTDICLSHKMTTLANVDTTVWLSCVLTNKWPRRDL